MRTFVRARAEPGELVTPNEINDELRDIVGAMHSLDRDNLPANLLTNARTALGAWGNILISRSEQAVDVEFPPGPSDLDSCEIHVIPFDLDGDIVVPWIEEFATGDCDLELSLGAQFSDIVDELTSRIWIGIRLDGVLVVRSPTQPDFTSAEHGYCTITVPVGAGTHILEAVYGRPFATTTRSLKWENRCMAAREIAR